MRTRLEFIEVTRRYTVAGAGVRDVSFEVGEGEIICLLGPSGAGKSTILRLAAGLEKPDAGVITIDGKEVAGEAFVAPEKRGVGLIFQDFALFPHMTVEDNVGFGLSGLSKSERAKTVGAMLERVNLTHLADAYPNTLSGGEQQRVALARALATRPGVMLMDEPFSDLDTQLRDQVRDELTRLLRNSGAATILVTHDPHEAMRVADRIILLRGAEIVQIGTPEDIYFDPVDAEAAAFFGDLNIIPGTVKGNAIETPLGSVAVNGRDVSADVDVLIRPVDLCLEAAAMSGPDVAVVAARRVVGGACLVDLDFGGTGMPDRLTAQVSLKEAPEVGSAVRLSFDTQHVHVFPRGKSRA